jgi:hypothetical protein
LKIHLLDLFRVLVVNTGTAGFLPASLATLGGNPKILEKSESENTEINQGILRVSEDKDPQTPNRNPS